jgi:hypothetical protein
MPTPGEFMKTAPGPTNSNTEWGMRYALNLRRVVITHASHSPRNLQRELGPSELGTPCDRQVAGKFAGYEYTNHVADPWASIMGIAGHMWMDEAFNAENTRQGTIRYFPEFRVHPYADRAGYSYPGKGDLYDILEAAVVDWKFLGDSSRDKIINFGPSRKYFVQLLLYGKGFRNMGLPVKRVVLVAWPRTRSTFDKTYVWDHLWTPEDDDLLAEVYQQTQARKLLGQEIAAGRMHLRDVPAVPDDDDCYFCPFFRAEAARDPAASGCPGHHLIPGRSNTTGP